MDEPLCIPKIRPIHLIVWLAIAVMLVFLDRTVSNMASLALWRAVGLSMVISWWTSLARVFVVSGFAACLVGSWMILRSRSSQKRARLQPGHWLVLLLALAGVLASIDAVLQLMLMQHKPPNLSSRWHSVPIYLEWSKALALGASFAYVLFRLRDALRWRVLLAFGLLSVLQIIGWTVVILFFGEGPAFIVPWMKFLSWFAPSWWAVQFAVRIWSEITSRFYPDSGRTR